MKALFPFAFIILISASCSQPVIPTTSVYESLKAERKVIYEAHLQLQVKEPDSVQVQILNLATDYNGFLVFASENTVTIRIPAENFTEAIGKISEKGKLTNQEILGEDVTDNFTDLAVRLENAEKTRARYLALLEKAVTVHEMLPIEKELERLNLEIEGLKGKLNRMDHLEKFATIHVRLEKKIQHGPLGYLAIGVYKVIKVLFVWS